MTLLISALSLAAPTASAGRHGRDRNQPAPPPVPVQVEPEPTPEVVPPPPTLGPLFQDALPMDIGPLPDGLSSLSAQACAGCHYGTHGDWSESAHAHAGQSKAFLAASAQAGTPACSACHLPLSQQRATTVVYDQGDVDRPVQRALNSVDVTLASEGVTCAVCHVREGMIAASRVVADAPHPMALAEDLASPQTCAACHQLTWPGRATPLYDTYGEWSRSPYASAGITCLDCHFGDGAEAGTSGHAMPSRGTQGLSVLVSASGDSLARGGDPIQVTLTLQNSGAGHNIPTGSPFKRWLVRAWLEGPAPRRSTTPTQEALIEIPLGQTIEDTSPWRTLEDTRLGPMEQRVTTWEPALPLSAPEGDWWLVVKVVRDTRGLGDQTVLKAWRTALSVD